MNIWEIRRLCHYLRCATDNRKIADFQREQAAEAALAKEADYE